MDDAPARLTKIPMTTMIMMILSCNSKREEDALGNLVVSLRLIGHQRGKLSQTRTPH